MKDLATTAVVVALVVAMPIGIVMAVYMNDASWLFFSLIAFIVIYAG